MRRFFTPVFYAVVGLCLCTVTYAQAQTVEKIIIKGRVIDAKDKLPIPGATVIEQDKDQRTVKAVPTDIDGNFALTVTDVKDNVGISSIGYNPVNLPIGTRRVFNVSLSSSTADLKEVTITSQAQSSNGTGLLIDRRDQTTSTFTLNAKDVETLQATTIDQAVQGRLPGVDIVSNSGDPGAGMSIKIRGTSSLNGVTTPLIVLDGVPYNTTIPTDFSFATANSQQYADLLAISPADIQDISVLKDAAATAVWGSKAANGVLLITTKRGKKGPPSINYQFKGSATVQPANIPLLTGDEYRTFIPEMVMNVAGVPLNTLTNREFENDPLDLYYYKNYGQNTDWVGAVTQHGVVYDNTLSISGGGDKARYYASLGYNNTTGTNINTGLTRLNTRLNLDYIVSDKIKFTTFVAYTNSNTANPYTNWRGVAQVKMPNMSIYEYNEFGILTPNYFTPASNIQGQYTTTSSSTYNPVAVARLSTANVINNRVTPHFTISFQLSPVLIATTDIQFDISSNTSNSFIPQSATGRPFTETTVNSASNSDNDTYDVSTKTNLIYTPKLGEKSTFTGLISLQSDDTKSLGFNQAVTNTASSFLTDPSAPGRVISGTVGSSINQTRTVAALVSGQYKYLDRYILAVSFRADGNSQFGANKRYGYFPAISGRYRLSGEPFMKKFAGWLDDLSLTGGYGVTGGAPGKDYLFYSIYNSTATTYLGLNGLSPSSIQLNNLSFESKKGTDAGISMAMFKNSLNVALNYYKTRTSNLLTPNLTIASYNGFTALPDLNVGVLDNEGLELSIFATPYKSKKLQIDFNFNISNNIGTLREISPYYATSSGDITKLGNYLSILQIGNPLGSIYGYKFKGVYSTADATIARDANNNKIVSPDGTPVQMRFNYPQVDYKFQPGDAQYEDINHDGNINFQDVVYLGNGNPKFTGGFGPSFTYKGSLSLAAFFTYRLGGDIINMTKLNTTNEIGYSNQSTAVLRRWRNPGDVTTIPRAVYNTGYNSLGSDRYVEDGTFLRLRSVTARYSFDKAIARRLSAKSLSVYVTVEGLLTFTHYTGQDPEVAPASGVFQQVTDTSLTPPNKIYTLGLSMSF